MPGSPSSARARRLLGLLPFLREQGSRSLSELASLAGTDVETVAADLTVLSLCGVGALGPDELVAVLVEDGEAVVFGDMPALDRPVRLSAVESRALLAALETLGVDAGSALVERLSFIAGSPASAGDIERTVRSAASPGGIAHTHAELAVCAASFRSIALSYASMGTSAPVERVVDPWRIFLSRGSWYLQAWAHDAGAERTFRLDRIVSARPTGSSFDPPEELPPTPVAAPDPTLLPRAEIEFARDDPGLDERWWPGTTFERRPDGTVVATVPYAGTRWIARKAAAWLGDAVVTGPEEVRAAVERVARDELAGLATPLT